MKSKHVVWSVAVAIALFAAAPCKANTIYDVDLTGFGASITGTIVTDGTIGAIGDSNIVSMSLTLSQGLNSALITGPLSSSTMNGVSWASTTSTGGLFFDFGAGIQNFFLGSTTGSFPSWVCFTGSSSGCGHGDIEMRINGSQFIESGSFYQGLTEIGSAETPLPAALPLFATGLGGLGLLGWRRKRQLEMTT
jgi:hypothetical protein